jgi:hypothetical protein
MCPSFKMKEHDELHQITNMQLMNIKNYNMDWLKATNVAHCDNL